MKIGLPRQPASDQGPTRGRSKQRKRIVPIEYWI